ncbi:TetR family transcriptional regulator [Tenuibacillus multivorans]|nr:TetR family transcriptional regulator [Tenuibacillus multivorans]
MDSFIDLSGKKEFKDITVKDITTEAMINRATFYYHFEDIYDLLHKALSEVLFVNLNCESYKNSELNIDTLSRIFIAITDFQAELSNRCHRGYEDTIARIIRVQLEIIFFNLLVRQHPNEVKEGLKHTATMLSWGLYGASISWRRNNDYVSPGEFIKTVIPYVQYGVLGNSR